MRSIGIHTHLSFLGRLAQLVALLTASQIKHGSPRFLDLVADALGDIEGAEVAITEPMRSVSRSGVATISNRSICESVRRRGAAGSSTWVDILLIDGFIELE